MFPRFCVCIIAITVFTFVYVVTVTEAQDVSAASTSPVLRRSNTNYLNFAGKTYYFGTIFKANFFQALQYCRQQGMQLVHIASQAVNERLEKFSREIGNEHVSYWTSGTNLGDKNKWIWLSTGNNLVYTNWHSGEPNGKISDGVEEHCMEVTHYLGESVFTWNDQRCDVALNFICETTENCSK